MCRKPENEFSQHLKISYENLAHLKRVLRATRNFSVDFLEKMTF